MTATTGLRPATQPSVERRQPDEERRRELTNLDHRYGRIGIPAVAAALHYTAATKNPAYAPVVNNIDWRFVEATA